MDPKNFDNGPLFECRIFGRKKRDNHCPGSVIRYDFYVLPFSFTDTPSLDEARHQLAEQLTDAEHSDLAAAPVDPWVAASGLQKGIRRGDEGTALACTKTLLLTDPERLWRRLCATAFEDVGLGDLEGLSQVTAIAGQKLWRQKHGGDALIATHLVRRLCRAVKERSTDDLSATADWHPEYADARHELVYERPNRLIDMLVDARQSLPIRAMAAWYLAGTDRLPRYRILPRRGELNQAFSIFGELGVPGSLLEVCRVATAKTRCPLPLMLPLIWLVSDRHTAECTDAINCNSFPASPEIEGIPAYVLDAHCRMGRRCISQFLNDCAPVQNWLRAAAPRCDRHKIVGMILFHVEGALLDRRLTWFGSAEVTRQGMTADVAGPGVPLNRVEEAMALVREHLPELHESRRRVFRQTPVDPREGLLL